MTRLPLLAALFALALTAPALAADTTVSFDVSSWIKAGSDIATAFLVPILTGVLAKAIAQYAPVLGLIFTQARIETMVRNGIAYGTNAVAGAAPSKPLTVDLGSQVIASGVRYLQAHAPAAIIRAAGGPDALVPLLFRALPFDASASEAAVLDAVKRQLSAA
ncbi:hypothetical protein [Methylobacterium sp. WSM2598]|uniref:hypothetical protein n=1 Tax=Methylobacterium sp. WSM2598 TaxID=398261 RepID=UPI0003753752|nr:hypothetical protein [Methylobacterium sp. WSM2598]